MAEMSESEPNSLLRLMNDYTAERENWLNIGTPWTTEGSKSWLARNINSTDRVLEFGAGRSTIFWARQAAKVTVVEGSPDWTFWTLFYLYQHPYLMKKIRWYLCPTEWNPSFPKGSRRYWTENRGSLDTGDVIELEKDLASASFVDNNVYFFDGNIRHLVFLYQIAKINFNKVDIIVIDNCETMLTSETADVLIPYDRFERLDFVAGPCDDIPVHQKGKHITSIFVSNERMKRSVIVGSHINPVMSRDSRMKYMHVVDGFDVDKEIDKGYKYLRDKLGLDVKRP